MEPFSGDPGDDQDVLAEVAERRRRCRLIAEDLVETAVEDFAAEGMDQIGAYLGKWAAFQAEFPEAA